MFWSKIWFFLVATAAALAVGAVLVTPRPAERKVLAAEDLRLAQSREVVGWLLQLDARNRVDLALGYARREIYVELKKVKDDREQSETIAHPLHDSAHQTLEALLAGTKGDKPSFLIALDAWGRAVARAGVEDSEWGDDLSGYFLVRDALRGYMRDDLWIANGKLYRVAAAPVITPKGEGPDAYVGVLIVGQEIDEALARDLELRVSSQCTDLAGEGTTATVTNCDTHVAFFARDDMIANSGPTTLGGDIRAEYKKRAEPLDAQDGKPLPLFTIDGPGSSWRVALKRLPGEAGAQDGFYAIYSEQVRGGGLVATLQNVVKEDVSPKSFPWPLLAGGFVLAVILGLVLMWMEVDRPLKRLLRDSLDLGKGEALSLGEAHRGKFGSIARSVNLALDRLTRERSSRRDMSAIFREDDGSGARALPLSGPGGPAPAPFTAPPHSDLELARASATPFFDVPPPPPPSSAIVKPARVSGPAAAQAARVITTPASGAPPPPPTVIPARADAPTPPVAVDDDLIGEDGLPKPKPAVPEAVVDSVSGFMRQVGTPDGEAVYFRQIYDDFIELKRKCGEPVDALTFDKFQVKLQQNRDQLVAKYACRAVRFQVYVKDGRAALKATPIKA